MWYGGVLVDWNWTNSEEHVLFSTSKIYKFGDGSKVSTLPVLSTHSGFFDTIVPVCVY